MLCGEEWSAPRLLDSICHVFLTSPASYPSPPILKRASLEGRKGDRPIYSIYSDCLPMHFLHPSLQFPGYFWHIDSLHFDSNFTIEGNTNDCECLAI